MRDDARAKRTIGVESRPCVTNGAIGIRMIESDQLMKDDAGETGGREQMRRDQTVRHVANQDRAGRAHRRRRVLCCIQFSGAARRPFAANREQRAHPLVHG